MAISYDLGLLLARSFRDNKIKGSILQLGRQNVYMRDDQIFSIISSYGFAKHDGKTLELLNEEYVSDSILRGTYSEIVSGEKSISDAVFFKLLGLDPHSCDVSDHDDCDFILDLNSVDGGAAVGRQFDVVFDGGTLEHVFHVPNALANVHSLLKTGGHVIHVGPANGDMDHGFYQISPCLFREYYRGNGYAVLESKVMTNSNLQGLRGFVCENYTNVNGVSSGQQYLYYVVAKKNPGATCNVIPSQRFTSEPMWDFDEQSDINPLTIFRLKLLLEQAGSSRVAIWCATHIAGQILQRLGSLRDTVACIVDRDTKKQGGALQGVPIISPEALLAEHASFRYIIIASGNPMSVYNTLSSDPILKPKLVLP